MLNKGDILKLIILKGARCYIAFGGGIKVDATLGSASVHGVSNLGGKPKQKGCNIPIIHEATHQLKAHIHIPQLVV